MRPRALAARRLRLLKSASRKRCRHLFGLAPWNRTGTGSHMKNNSKTGVKGACPLGLLPIGGEGVILTNSTEWIIQMISHENFVNSGTMMGVKDPHTPGQDECRRPGGAP